jgi:hypothetical protein
MLHPQCRPARSGGDPGHPTDRTHTILAWDGCLCARAGPYSFASPIRRLSLNARTALIEPRRDAGSTEGGGDAADRPGHRPCPGRQRLAGHSGAGPGAAAAQAAPVGALQADLNNDGFADLGVGAPFEAVGSAVAAGAVSAVAESTGGLGGGLLLTQASAGVPSVAEREDFFGWALRRGRPRARPPRRARRRRRRPLGRGERRRVASRSVT